MQNLWYVRVRVWNSYYDEEFEYNVLVKATAHHIAEQAAERKVLESRGNDKDETAMATEYKEINLITGVSLGMELA